MIDLEIWTLGIGFSDLAIYCRFIRFGNRYFSPNVLHYFWAISFAYFMTIGTLESLTFLGRISHSMATSAFHTDGLADGVLVHLVALLVCFCCYMCWYNYTTMEILLDLWPWACATLGIYNFGLQLL